MLSEINQGFYSKLRLWPETWASNTTYQVGDLVKAVTYASKSYLVTTAGTTGSTEPTWSTSVGNTVSSGTVTFTVKDSKTYQVKAPQSASCPYVTFGLNTEVPMGDFSDFETIENLTYWVNCFSSKSTADVAEISDEVMSILDDSTLTVSGYTSMKCVRTFMGSVIYDPDTLSYQQPLRYRVWVTS